MSKKLKVCWLSAGVSSLIAGYLAKDVDEYIYIHIKEQHEDSLRFIKDCEKFLGKEVKIIESGSVHEVIKNTRFINGAYGARCTLELKKKIRQAWEQEHADYDITYVWGYDLKEKHRAERIKESFPEFNHEFPLIENKISKPHAHGILKYQLHIERPEMYNLGYNNNNCIGCVKGGMGYWNKIRREFPEVFNAMAKLEREVGHSCIKGIYLDELDPNRGRKQKEVIPECNGLCEHIEEEDLWHKKNNLRTK